MAIQPIETKEIGPIVVVILLAVAAYVVMYHLGYLGNHPVEKVVGEPIAKIAKKPLQGIKKIEGLFENKDDKLNNNNNKVNVMDIKEGETYQTDSGLKFEVLKLGNGKKPTLDNEVTVHYHGTLLDGTVFDSSVVRGEKISFPLRGVIAGWQEGLQYMPIGSKFKFVIPANLAYGDSSPSPAIPAGSTLVFEVELFDVK